MKNQQEISITSVEYRDDEETKEKLIKFVIDFILDNFSGGVNNIDTENTETT